MILKQFYNISEWRQRIPPFFIVGRDDAIYFYTDNIAKYLYIYYGAN